MTIRMTALKAFSYAHRALRPGVEFSVKSERDARLLSAIGRARLVVDAPVAEAPPTPKMKRQPKKAALVIESPREQIPEAAPELPAAPEEGSAAEDAPAEEPNEQQGES